MRLTQRPVIVEYKARDLRGVPSIVTLVELRLKDMPIAKEAGRLIALAFESSLGPVSARVTPKQWSRACKPCEGVGEKIFVVRGKASRVGDKVELTEAEIQCRERGKDKERSRGIKQ